jgi:hypothetical protein
VHRIACVILVVLAILVARPSPAQGQAVTQATPLPQAPATGPRDPAKPKDTGTARISGRVVNAESGTPLRRAEVMLGSETLKEARSTSTDEAGRYEFKDLPAGRYTLSASKAGFAFVSYGQKRPFQPGRPLEVADGLVLQRIDVSLPRGGVIAGRLTDEFGEPVAGIGVRAMRYSYANGKRQLAPVGFGSTDDRGQYRIFGLAASEYYVAAQPGGGFGFTQSDSKAGFAPTFYPGTPSVTEAQRLRVAAGSENAAVNFALVPARTVKVSGTVIRADGQPASQGFLMLQTGGQDETSFTVTGAGIVQSDGTFTISGVGPGDYVLHLSLGDNEDAESGSLPISVNGAEDVTGLTLTTSRPSTVAGQVVFDAAAPDRLRPAEFGFFLQAATPAMAFWGSQLVPKEDWTFEARGGSGTMLVQPGRLPDGWMLKSVLLNGEDVTDAGITPRSGERLEGLQIVMTSRLTRVNGTAVNDVNQAARDYVAVLFPDDPALWTRFTRRVRVETPDQQGRFESAKLPPGHYLAAALEYIEDGQQTDPEFLESLRAWATPFDLREGETKALTLKVAARR